MPDPRLDHKPRELFAAAVARIDPKGNGLNDATPAHAIAQEPEPTHKRRLHPLREEDDFS